jgi:hypothetical protein
VENIGRHPATGTTLQLSATRAGLIHEDMPFDVQAPDLSYRFIEHPIATVGGGIDLAPADFDGDGKLDLVTLDGTGPLSGAGRRGPDPVRGR